MKIEIEIIGVDQNKVEEFLLSQGWKKCSHNEMGEYKFSEENNNPAWFKPDGTYEDNSVCHKWFCWAEFWEEAFEGFLEDICFDEKIIIIKKCGGTIT